MKIFRPKTITIATLFILSLGLSACSSNNSDTSSGSGGSASPSQAEETETNHNTNSPAEATSLAGTYTGTATATASALALSQSETVPITITIDQNNRVSIQSGSDVLPDAATLVGNSFSQRKTFNAETVGSAVCSGTLTLQGNINNSGLMTATLSSQSATCAVNGASIPGTITGSLTANRQ